MGKWCHWVGEMESLYKEASLQNFFKKRAKERNWEGDRCSAKRTSELPSITVRKLGVTQVSKLVLLKLSCAQTSRESSVNALSDSVGLE